MTSLRLAWDATLPPLAEHDGRRVTWKPWEQVTMFICGDGVSGWSCDACGATGTPLTSIGTIHPAPGETVTTTEHRARRTGRVYEGLPRQVPAWPYLRLHAARCPACGDTRIHDMGRSGDDWIDLSSPSELTLW